MSLPSDNGRHPASYRDLSGFIFTRNGTIYRQINKVYKEEFSHFTKSGLYSHLVEQSLLIPHSVINQNLTGSAEWYCTLQPQQVPFISYPYEWTFDMLKDAALLTLQLAKEAMNFGMMLKDATPFNLQLLEGKLVFIDTLSFERYDAAKPWIAYRQFCENFLAPLALMHFLKQPLQPLMMAYPEGMPLPLVAQLLPFRSKLHLNIALHLHLHARYTAKEKSRVRERNIVSFTTQKLKNILHSLEQAIDSLHFDQPTGTWSHYYEEALQRDNYIVPKQQIIAGWLRRLSFASAIDFGANEGVFSILISQKNSFIISTDFDHFSVNKLYHYITKEKIKNIHPLLIDISNPSPAIGVNNEERSSFSDRVHCDLMLALALIHHLAIGKNIPFEWIARFFKKTGKYLIIEFVPKEDEKVQLMLSDKKDIYHWYSCEQFLEVFMQYFILLDKQEIDASKRTLYLMQAKS